MDKSIFRKKSMDRISSPEQLDDYLYVTSPAVWVILLAVILLLAGFLFWGSVTKVESFAAGTAYAQKGVLTVTFDDENKAERVEAGMDLTVGDYVTPVLSVGRDENGKIFAVAEASIPDGRYEVKVGYNNTQLIDILFNGSR